MKHCPQCSTGYPDSLAACPTHGVPLNEIRDLKPGMIVHHSYRIVRKLGQGGMGAVYLAQHTLMDEPRALKFLSPELSRDQDFTARFLREVRTLRQIRNRNVVDCGDLERAEDDSLFFSMEFVDGPDLRRFLHDAKGTSFSPYIETPDQTGTSRQEEKRQGTTSVVPQLPQIEARALAPAGSLPVPLALHIASQIAQGLAAAHARGMVHRDIKPENILMAREAGAWLPKIADFGIVATKESSTAFTRTGGTLLTVTYAAPEQWRGTPAADLDGRTDLYALGGLLYEMLTGQTVFHALNYEGWAWQHQNTPPKPPSALRPELANWQGLDALVLRLLAKDREDRPKDVAELLGLIDAVWYLPHEARRETVSEDTAMDATQASAENSPDPAILSRSWWAAAVVSMLLVALLVFGLSRSKTSNEPIERPQIDSVSGAAVAANKESEPQTWTDPATGLMWTKKDNGSDVNWQQASDYCRNLQLAGPGWRLPSIKELQSINGAYDYFKERHVKGNLELSGWWHWSSTKQNASWKAWNFDYLPDVSKGQVLHGGNDSRGGRALCVRHPGE
jgi:serine/threonine protein kinase